MKVRAVLLGVALLSNAAAAHTRLAVVVGHNRGAEGRTALRYAETDAARVRRALVEVAGVAESDVKLLQAPGLAALDEAFGWAKQRTAEVHGAPGQKVVLYVYLSGHGHDGRGVELGGEVLSWERLKARVRGSGADVKLAIIDACNASGVFKAGGQSTDAFELEAQDRLTVEGEAWITSSAENEPSVEAGAWRGSVFTHHLVAGLRGAADRSADRRVSLEELYRYAFERTTSGEAGQHPGYAFRLSGYGELEVSDLGRAPAQLTLPPGMDAVTVTEQGSGESLIEARHPLSRTLGFGAGRLDVRLLKGTQAWATQVELSRGDRVSIDESQLARIGATTALTVRLSSRCLEVSVPRPDPRLNALKARLQGQCDRPERAVLGRGDQGQLKLELEGRTVEAADEKALLEALQ
ncbi:MAG: caspase family protein [Archangiaceae bacterium]|nr:caspase family protein [Archangiaceae bacterium]